MKEIMSVPILSFIGFNVHQISYLWPLHRVSLTTEVLVNVIAHLSECGKNRGLIRLLIILDWVIKYRVFVSPTAYFYDKVSVTDFLVQIAGHIFDQIAICLLDKIRWKKGHGDDSIGDVGEAEFFTSVGGEIYGPWDYFFLAMLNR